MELRGPSRLADRMREYNVSQRELAKVAGWKSHSYLSRSLSGSETTLNTDPALKIAFYLGMDVSDLFITQSDSPPAERPTPRRRRPNRGR
ncbi:helix-turn-helix transcriptional regulator [Brachybacterium sp. GPGPB12]|uniref:helix-turn-helix domain-containing protein n=1 Tax=Brachybacterium sp. GPGPB12 TaxID=3023517 RepID=UPI0031344366